jgi:hypothetical protein
MAVALRAAGVDPRPGDLNLDPETRSLVSQAVLGLDAWLESTRLPGGYGGPVAHWWWDCLDYTGPGLDWRYEGILAGYLNLWALTGEEAWLAKACRAGDDLVAGQLPSGNYRNSCFELNPNTGGTPHEAACDLALIRLGAALREENRSGWEAYVETARRNLEAFCIGRLWDEAARSFRDDPSTPSFVPNKAATLCEALFALSHLEGEAIWAEHYALPTLEAVLSHQVRGGALDGAAHGAAHGAIYQNSFGPHKVAKFFPFYISRCIPGLLEGWAWSGEARFAEAARLAAEFVALTRYPDGSFPQVRYPGGRVNRYPQWIAACGDILRALDLARQVGFSYDPAPTLDWLLAGRREDGGFRTARGFGSAVPGGRADDPRDDLAVVGWADKAFRYLTTIVDMEFEV